MIGPPSVAPNCWRFSSSVSRAKKLRASKVSSRMKSKSVPWNWSAPDLVVALSAPPAWLNSAV